MAYPNAKFNSNGYEVGPSSSHCQYEVYQTNLHIQTLLQVSVKHISTNQTCFICIPYSVTIMYKTFLLTESQTFLKSTN